MKRRKASNTTKTLLIDGNYLLKRSFHIKENINNQRIYAFISTIRKLVKQLNSNKIIVFWDSDDSGILKQEIISTYKANRLGKTWSKVVLTEKEALAKQMEQETIFNMKMNIKNYLEHLFIRQLECEQLEGDDLIAYYSKIATNENITIFSNDRDLLQLLKYDNVSVIMANKTLISEENGFETTSYLIINQKNYNKYFKVHYDNIKLSKTLTGDSSDNIFGFNRLTENRLLKDFTKIKSDILKADDIIDFYIDKEDGLLHFCVKYKLDTFNYNKIKDIEVKIKDNSIEVFDISFKMVNKKIKDGVYNLGEIFNKCKYNSKKYIFIEEIMKYLNVKSVYYNIDVIKQGNIIDLINPIMNDMGLEYCQLMHKDVLSPKDRGGKYLIQLMYNDNFLDNFRFIRWEDKKLNNKNYINYFKEYCQPFLNIIKTEKSNYEQFTNQDFLG